MRFQSIDLSCPLREIVNERHRNGGLPAALTRRVANGTERLQPFGYLLQGELDKTVLNRVRYGLNLHRAEQQPFLQHIRQRTIPIRLRRRPTANAVRPQIARPVLIFEMRTLYDPFTCGKIFVHKRLEDVRPYPVIRIELVRQSSLVLGLRQERIDKSVLGTF